MTAARRDEQRRMRAYVETDACMMRCLTRELDDPAKEACGRCANCAGPFAPLDADPTLVRDAQVFLRRAYRPLEPRRQWPRGFEDRNGARIPEEHRLREGRALAVYGDAGWGQLVKEGKFGEGGFADELVDAVAEMIRIDLEPDPPPAWVTSVPSLRAPDLVPSFAQRLADRLGLPYRSTLVKTRTAPPQKTMQNRVQQAGNASGAYVVDPDAVSEGPVLLVDDMVDSGWTLTVCGVALAEAGSGPVYPVVLGQATPGGGP